MSRFSLITFLFDAKSSRREPFTKGNGFLILIKGLEKSYGNINYQCIQHTWKDGKCIYCGDLKSEYDRGTELESPRLKNKVLHSKEKLLSLFILTYTKQQTMNNTSKILKGVIFTLLITLGSSCSEESSSPLVDQPVIDSPSQEEKPSEEAKTTITATLPEFVSSRLAFSATDDGKTNSIKINWKESGESFSMIRGGENQTFKQVEGSTFSGVLPQKGSGAYYVIYPCNTSATNEETIPFDFSKQNGNLNEAQTYMYAILKDEEVIEFKHLAILTKLSLHLPSGSGTLQSLSLKGESLTAKGTFNLKTGQLQIEEKSTQEIQVNSSANEQYIYLPPMSKGWELQVTATTENGTYTSTLKDASSEGTGNFQNPSLTFDSPETGIVTGSNIITDETVPSANVAGSGTESDPYLISSGSDLLWLRDRANAGKSQENNYYKLTTDITIQSTTWTPIGGGKSSIIEFSGYFDGCDHIINGKMKSVPTKDIDYFGLFGAIENGCIKNLHINAEVVGGINHESKGMITGAIVGSMQGRGCIENCTNSGPITGKSTTGGLIGEGYYLEADFLVKNCKNTGVIIGGNRTGGIVGYGYAPIYANESIINCTNEGNISGRFYTGGIVGQCGILMNCSNTGIITGTESTGGLAGGEATCISSSNSGKVIGTKDVGGLVGDGDAENCINKGEIIGEKTTGGIAGLGDGIISYCNNEGIVNGGGSTGGIVGSTWEDAEILHCINNGTVNGGGYTGGIAGVSRYIGNCQNNASVTGKGCTGGIVGNHYHAFMADCTNTGEVSGTGATGGIAGLLKGNSYSNLINKGTLSVQADKDGNTYIGGVAGYAVTSQNLIACENHAPIKGGIATNASYTGGIIGYGESIEMEACINKATGILTPGEGKEVYTGGLIGYDSFFFLYSCCKDESQYKENDKRLMNGNPDPDATFFSICDKEGSHLGDWEY